MTKEQIKFFLEENGITEEDLKNASQEQIDKWVDHIGLIEADGAFEKTPSPRTQMAISILDELTLEAGWED